MGRPIRNNKVVYTCTLIILTFSLLSCGDAFKTDELSSSALFHGNQCLWEVKDSQFEVEEGHQLESNLEFDCETRYGRGSLNSVGDCVISQCKSGFVLDCIDGDCSNLGKSSTAFCRKKQVVNPAHSLGKQRTLPLFVRDPDKQFDGMRTKERALEALQKAASIIRKSSHGRVNLEILGSHELITNEELRNLCINGHDTSQPRVSALVAKFVEDQFHTLPDSNNIDAIAIFNANECYRGNSGSRMRNGVKYITINSFISELPRLLSHEFGHAFGSGHHGILDNGLTCLEPGPKDISCMLGGSISNQFDIMGGSVEGQFSAASMHEWGWINRSMSFPEKLSHWEGYLKAIEQPANDSEYHLIRFRTPIDKTFPNESFFFSKPVHHFTFEYSQEMNTLIARSVSYRPVHHIENSTATNESVLNSRRITLDTPVTFPISDRGSISFHRIDDQRVRVVVSPKVRNLVQSQVEFEDKYNAFQAAVQFDPNNNELVLKAYRKSTNLDLVNGDEAESGWKELKISSLAEAVEIGKISINFSKIETPIHIGTLKLWFDLEYDPASAKLSVIVSKEWHRDAYLPGAQQNPDKPVPGSGGVQEKARLELALR